MIRVSYIVFCCEVVLFLFCGVGYSVTNTNGVILPQTEFFVEGAVSPVIEERNVSVPTRGERKELYEAPTIRSVDILEAEARKEFSNEVRSRIVSLFSYGMNDILNFSLIGLSQIPVDSASISTVIKYTRSKRPDVVFQHVYPVTMKNTLRDTDLANVSVGFSSPSVSWNTVFDFSDDSRGLWNNPTYLDEKIRDVSFVSEFKYRLDRDSLLSVNFEADHCSTTLRSREFLSYYTAFNDLFLEVGYKYGVEEFNFFGVNLGVGAQILKFTYAQEFSSGVYGDVSFSLMFPVYANTWFFGVEAGIIPDTFLPMEWNSRVSVGYKPSDSVFILLSVFREYARFDPSFLGRGVSSIFGVSPGDSSLGVELNQKLFFLGNSSVNTFVGYCYYFSKVFDKYENGTYVPGITNVNVVFAKVLFDIVSFEWFSLGGSYRFSFFAPSIPYVSMHSIEGIAKIDVNSFSFSLGFTGESPKGSTFGSEDIAPYMIVFAELEWEVVKNISVIVKADNILNNIVEVRKDSVVLDSFHLLGGLKVKL